MTITPELIWVFLIGAAATALGLLIRQTIRVAKAEAARDAARELTYDAVSAREAAERALRSEQGLWGPAGALRICIQGMPTVYATGDAAEEPYCAEVTLSVENLSARAIKLRAHNLSLSLGGATDLTATAVPDEATVHGRAGGTIKLKASISQSALRRRGPGTEHFVNLGVDGYWLAKLSSDSEGKPVKVWVSDSVRLIPATHLPPPG